MSTELNLQHKKKNNEGEWEYLCGNYILDSLPVISSGGQAGFVTWGMLCAVLVASIIYAVIPLVEKQSYFDWIGFRVKCCERVSGYMSDVMGKSSDAFWRIGKDVPIFSPSPNIKKFLPVHYVYQVFTANRDWQRSYRRVWAGDHLDCFPASIREVKLIGERRISQRVICIKEQGFGGRFSTISPNGTDSPKNGIVRNISMGEIGEIEDRQVSAQFSLGGIVRTLDQTTSRPPQRKSSEEQKPSESGDRVGSKLVPPIFIWLAFAALGITGLNWAFDRAYYSRDSARRRFWWTICFCISACTIYLLFFNWGIGTLWGIL